MSSSLRTLIGTVILVVAVPVYAMIAMLIAIAVLQGVGFGWQMIYYVVAGLAWVPPAAVLIKWMAKR